MPFTLFGLPQPEILMQALDPEAAIAFWAWKAAMPYDAVKKMDEGARERAFYVTGLSQVDMVQTVQGALDQSLKNGTGLRDFKKQCADVIESQGWHDTRVETIFRNNMQTAYAAGRYAKMQEVKETRPYWQYYTVEDTRVRPGHAILHKKVYPADHEFWRENYPPNGHRCRCGVRTLSKKQALREGLTIESDMPESGYYTDKQSKMEFYVAKPGADNGWQGNPGKSWTDGLDLSRHDVFSPGGYKEHRAQPQLAPVKNFPQLKNELMQHCGKFLRNSNGFTQIEKDYASYLMATDSKGALWISARKFPTPYGVFQPAKALQSGWSKLANGKQLDWLEEYAFESLWHEITHNRQINIPLKRGFKKNFMETIVQWTARRTYPEFLKTLGGNASHAKDIQRNGLGYGTYIRNFDAIIKALKVDEEHLLEVTRDVVENTPMDSYVNPIVEFLSAASGKDKKRIQRALRDIDCSSGKDFSELET